MRSVSAGSVGMGAGNVVFALALRTRAVFVCRCKLCNKVITLLAVKSINTTNYCTIFN